MHPATWAALLAEADRADAPPRSPLLGPFPDPSALQVVQLPLLARDVVERHPGPAHSCKRCELFRMPAPKLPEPEPFPWHRLRIVPGYWDA